MIDNTINDNKTIAACGKGVILVGRYHILRQLGQGTWMTVMCNPEMA